MVIYYMCLFLALSILINIYKCVGYITIYIIYVYMDIENYILV